jgi:hypothetical protein
LTLSFGLAVTPSSQHITRCTVTLCVTDGDGGRGVDRFVVTTR